MNDLQALLAKARRQFDTQEAFAKALGLSAGRLSKLLGGRDLYRSLEVKNCLQLALILNITPTTVLRAANKSDVADMLDHLYGEEQRTKSDAFVAALSDPEMAALVAQLVVLPDEAVTPLATVVRLLAAAVQQPPGRQIGSAPAHGPRAGGKRSTPRSRAKAS